MGDQFELEREKAIDEAILSSVGDGLIATDSEGKIVLINRAAQSMLMVGANDVIGKDFIETVPAADINGNLIPREKRPINVVLKTGISFTNHAANFYIKSDGTKFPAAITTSPIIFENSIIGAIITFRDNTREKEVDAMKSDFLSVAAHQLRTPLGSIRWNLEMILDGDYGIIPANLLPIIKQIYQANSRMIMLINDLLDVARIDELRVQDNPEICDLEKVIEMALADKKGDIAKKNIRIFFIPTDDPHFKIQIDPKRFQEAVDNLLSNAIKYNNPGGYVSITLENISPFIRISFIDSGIGIPNTDVHKITNKFFRASNAIRSETEGSGLGLFVVKSYIESWGGRLEFSSQEGAGSTFIIYLPMNPKSHTLDKSLTFKQ